jgi:regulator of PEP synthase PpsR (kinase-PPPase family)
MNSNHRTVLIVSDGTGITAETFSHSILAQFETSFKQIRMPFVNTLEKAQKAKLDIDQIAQKTGTKPIVFSTLVNPEINQIIHTSKALVMDMFNTFVAPLEIELNLKSTHAIGRFHQNIETEGYKNRIEAINFSLAHDDRQSHQNLDEAEVILVGVSRSGKTPTSLYLAMQYGIKSANYPLIPEDFERGTLPKELPQYHAKLFGLTINAKRLSEIRNERRPGSKYASQENCRYEVNEAEAMMQRENIPSISSTHKSIEEISTTILQILKSDKTAY